MNTKTRKTALAESVVLSLAQAADEDAVINQWGLSVAEIEADLTPEQLAQSQDWLDSLIAGARLRFTEDDVTYYYENGKYYSVYGDSGAYDGSNVIGEPEEISPEMMAVVLLGIHLDAGTLHVVGESTVTSLRFKPDRYNEVPVNATVSIPEKRGFELQAELQPDLDSDDPENYFTLDLYRFDKKAKSKQLLDSLGGIDGRDADYINQLLQTMLDEQGLGETSTLESSMSEGEMLAALSKYVKRTLKLGVMEPDFRKTTAFSAQWKVVGNTYYYQLPGANGLIIALRNPTTGNYQFDPDGLPEPTLEAAGSFDGMPSLTEKRKPRLNEFEVQHLVSTHEYRNRSARVYRDPDTSEFVVKFYENDVHLAEADYFTDDKGDAQGAAKTWTSGADRDHSSAWRS